MSEHERRADGHEQGQGVTGPNTPPVTGDPGVDHILTDLDSQLRRARADDQPVSEGGDLTDADADADAVVDTVTALTEAHRRLQARLTDPGPAPPPRG